MPEHYQTEREITAVVVGFENCTTGKEEFTHLSHLTVAAYYLCSSTPKESFEKMREGLLRFLDHHGIDNAKSNDRVTWAWIEQIQSVIEQMDDGVSLLVIVNSVVEQLNGFRIDRDAQTEDGDRLPSGS
jgi:hypothetical protein